ncbi:MAG: tail protein X [Defluviitaleaceae bacterium]|nr:tail protein X [Defluviitaleaceae bacterium]
MPKIYNTALGDMWDSVAFKVGLTESHTRTLMEANIEYARYYVFPANIRLVIPDVPRPRPEGLPPWKRGES